MTEPAPYPIPPRTWWNKFKEASRGIGFAIRDNQKSFAGHAMATVFALFMCIYLQCERWEWCIVVLTVGILWTAEMVNSAIEALFHGLETSVRARFNPCLDIASGAVLLASGFAVVIALLIFGVKLWDKWQAFSAAGGG